MESRGTYEFSTEFMDFSNSLKKDRLVTQNATLVHRFAVARDEKSTTDKEKEEITQRFQVLEQMHLETNVKLKRKERELQESRERFAEVQCKTQDLCDRYDSGPNAMDISLKSLTSGNSSNMSLLEELAGEECMEGPMPVDAFSQLRVEATDTYNELQVILTELESGAAGQVPDRGRHSSIANVQEIQDGALIAITKQARRLIRGMRYDKESMEDSAKTREHEIIILKEKITGLENRVNRSGSGAAGCPKCSDQSEVRQADFHLKKCEDLEQELSLAHLAIVKLERELFETIQKKVQVSQQLELWQIDMEEYIDLNVQKRLTMEAKQRRQFLLEKESKSRRKKSKPFSMAAIFASRKSLP